MTLLLGAALLLLIALLAVGRRTMLASVVSFALWLGVLIANATAILVHRAAATPPPESPSSPSVAIADPCAQRRIQASQRREARLSRARELLERPRRTLPRHARASADHIQERIRHIIVEHLGVNVEDVISDAALVEDLGADSLDTVELVMALEQEFGIEMTLEEAEQIRRVRDMETFVRSHAPQM